MKETKLIFKDSPVLKEDGVFKDKDVTVDNLSELMTSVATELHKDSPSTTYLENIELHQGEGNCDENRNHYIQTEEEFWTSRVRVAKAVLSSRIYVYQIASNPVARVSDLETEEDKSSYVEISFKTALGDLYTQENIELLRLIFASTEYNKRDFELKSKDGLLEAIANKFAKETNLTVLCSDEIYNYLLEQKDNLVNTKFNSITIENVKDVLARNELVAFYNDKPIGVKYIRQYVSFYDKHDLVPGPIFHAPKSVALRERLLVTKYGRLYNKDNTLFTELEPLSESEIAHYHSTGDLVISAYKVPKYSWIGSQDFGIGVRNSKEMASFRILK